MEVHNHLKTICTTFFHDTLGKLRTIYTGDNLLFCIYDVSKVLGHTDDGKSLRRFCNNIQKHKYGKKTLSFMDAGDIDELFQRDHSPEAENLLYWIHEIIVPEVQKTDGENEKTGNEVKQHTHIENPLLLIPRLTYESIAYSYAVLCNHLTGLCEKAASTPVRADTIELKYAIQQCRQACESLLALNGFSWEDMAEFDTEKIFDRLDDFTISPEKAGYVAYDQVVEAFGQMAADFLTDWQYNNG